VVSAILSIYPTVASTRVALFEDGNEAARFETSHDLYELYELHTVAERYKFRLIALSKMMSRYMPQNIRIEAIVSSAIVPRGTKPGTYEIGENFLASLRRTENEGRITNQGAFIAASLASARGARALAVCPVSSGEFDVIAKISGLPGLVFGRITHALAIKRAVRAAAEKLGASFEKVSLVVASLGNNFTICSYSEGRIRDLANTFERGPFSQSRCGSVPAYEIIRMAYSGMWSKTDLVRFVNQSAGLSGYTGTKNLRKVVASMEDGDVYATLVVRAMAYQAAAEIAAQATVLRGEIDAIVLAGEWAVVEPFACLVKEYISWITDDILVFPGEDELVLLARAARRFLGRE
jgi:butyrate kinase